MAVEFFTKLFNSALIFQRRQILAGREVITICDKPENSVLPCLAKIIGQFSNRLENRVLPIKKPAVPEVESGGFGFFVFGDEAAGEGGHI
jgi:hypothetical protein